MSHYNGEEFVKKLKDLQIPGSSDLCGSDYDWMFLDDKNGALPQFWSWFAQNITEEDVLVDEQLEKYRELVKDGSALTTKQIEQMDGLLGITPVVECSKGSFQVPEPSDYVDIEKEIDCLKSRQNIMHMETLSLQEEINFRLKAVKNLESSLQRETTECLGNEAAQKAVLKELSSVLEDICSQLMSVKNEGPYLHQISLDDWTEAEELQTKLMHEFVEKQFNQELSDMGENKDSATYELIDVEDLGLHMIKGPTYEEYRSDVLELRRLHKGITFSELDIIETKLEGVKLKAQTSSTMDFVKRLRDKKIPMNLSVLRSETGSLEMSCDASEKCVEKKKSETEDLARAVSLMERSKTIAGNYSAKLKRQQYFLDKQNYVLEQLLAKWSRCELLYAIAQKECHELDDLMAPMVKISQYLREKNVRSKQRLELILEHLSETESQKEIDIFETRKAELDESQDLLVAIRKLEAIQAKTKEEKMSHLEKLHELQRIFERCLVGQYKSSLSLPHSWLNPTLVARTSNLEEEHWKCMKTMVAINEDYETKKKILDVNENVKKEQTSWISKTLKTK